jgi:hypothetical protein
LYVAYCVVREANHRLTGVRRDASFPTTVFVLTMLAVAFAPIGAPLVALMRRLRGPRPSLAGTGMALAAGRHVTSHIAGEELRGTAYVNAIIAFGFVAPAMKVAMLPLALARAAWAGASRTWRYLMRAAARGRVA